MNPTLGSIYDIEKIKTLFVITFTC